MRACSLNCRLALHLVVVLVMLSTVALAQGPLVPPGPPAPSMKSLQELFNASGPRTPITSIPFTINQPGSYVLTQSLTGAAAQNGITILASNVTLDLNGHALRGAPGALHGIHITAGVRNVVITNGKLVKWPGSGIAADATARVGMITNVVASENGLNGIELPSIAIARDCEATSNTEVGVYGQSQALIQSCVARYNGEFGIVAYNSGIVENSITVENAIGGIAGVFNTIIRGNNSRENGSIGILVNINCIVQENNAHYGPPPLIFKKKSSPLLSGIGLSGGVGDLEGGIVIGGTFNRIESNTVSSCDIGYNYRFDENFIVKNVAMQCGEGFVQSPIPFSKKPAGASAPQPAVAGIQTILIAPIQTTFDLSDPGPWDNFNFYEGSVF